MTATLRGWLLLCLACAVLAVAALPTSARAAVTSPGAVANLPALGRTLDTRTEEVGPSRGQRDAARRLGPERVTFGKRFGTPRSIARLERGHLTGPAAGDPVAIARGWLRDHRDVFGLDARDIAGLAVVRDHALPGTGAHVINFQQVVGGLRTAFGGQLIVAVTADGRVASYAGDPTRATSAPAPARLSATDAVRRAASLLAPGTHYAPAPAGSARRSGYQAFVRGPFSREQYVRPIAFPAATGARSAWHVVFAGDPGESWNVVVDARSGKLLYRESLVAHEAPAVAGEGSVFDYYPGAAAGGGQVIRSFRGDPVASPAGWIGPARPDGYTTEGNNVTAYADWDLPLDPDGPRPFSPSASFRYPFANAWLDSRCAPPAFKRDLNPAATNLFYQVNRLHDRYYALGFTETAGNFQKDNFGRGGSGEDPIYAIAQGAANDPMARNNAFFDTPPEGAGPALMVMLLFESLANQVVTPCVDSAFDAATIIHEYTHGLSVRYVGGGDGLGSSKQAKALGEGWSDWYSLDDLDERGLERRGVVGPYNSGNDDRGPRDFNYDRNPLNYGDVGYSVFGPESHADGQIWAAALWDLRKAMIARHGREQGLERTRHLVTDAMPVTARDPSFLDARNGLIVADAIRYRGANLDRIWTAFARRGMGVSARTSSANDTQPTPGFDAAAPGANGVVAGEVVDASSGRPVAGARVIVGAFEAGASPLATTDAAGRFRTPMIAGRYTLTVRAPGYGAKTVSGVTVRAGALNRPRIALEPNVASAQRGARVVSATSEDAAYPATNLIDDTRATAWLTSQQQQTMQASVVIRLAAPTTVAAVRVSAMPPIFDPFDLAPLYSAVRDWRLEVSTDGTTWAPATRGAFRSTPPLPATPDLNRDDVAFPPVRARFVRFTANGNQGSVPQISAASVEVLAAHP